MNYKKFIRGLQKKELIGFCSCLFTSFKMCRDNYVGTISTTTNSLFLQKEFRYNNRRLLYKQPSVLKNKIVVLIESPHKNEFMLNLVAPALGNTGDKLHMFLPRLLLNNRLIDSNESEIYLVNCINYQCSLGYDTSVYRDKVFNNLWREIKIQNSLKRRLIKISPNVIINAVTSNQKQKISKFLQNIKLGTLYEADSHPSVWTNQTCIKPV